MNAWFDHFVTVTIPRRLLRLILGAILGLLGFIVLLWLGPYLPGLVWMIAAFGYLILVINVMFGG